MGKNNHGWHTGIAFGETVPRNSKWLDELIMQRLFTRWHIFWVDVTQKFPSRHTLVTSSMVPFGTWGLVMVTNDRCANVHDVMPVAPADNDSLTVDVHRNIGEHPRWSRRWLRPIIAASKSSVVSAQRAITNMRLSLSQLLMTVRVLRFAWIPAAVEFQFSWDSREETAHQWRSHRRKYRRNFPHQINVHSFPMLSTTRSCLLCIRRSGLTYDSRGLWSTLKSVLASRLSRVSLITCDNEPFKPHAWYDLIIIGQFCDRHKNNRWNP